MITIILLASININNWTIKQWESYQTYTFSNISIPDNGYLILSRNASKVEFENYWGNLPENVIYINSENSCPLINGGESYSLYDSLNLRIDTTYFIMDEGNCYQRESTNTDNWIVHSAAYANPGSGVVGGNSSGLLITEVSDAIGSGNYIYEFIELFNNTGTENTPPEIIEVKRHPVNPVEDNNVIIRSNAFDNLGIISDTLYWSVNNSNFNKISCDSANNSFFYYSIAPANKGDSVTYYVKVWDESLLYDVSDTFNYITEDSSLYKVLFDFTKEETAGNADWIIDNNMPEPIPVIPWEQEDWLGGISDWAYSLYRNGHFIVKTLHSNDSITYGRTRYLDLSNFDLFIVCEPQDTFNINEKTAIFNFIRDGGGLFMIGNHNGSDRNGNNLDSPKIWNDFGSTDSFGIHFNESGEYPNNFSDSSINYSTSDSVLSGYFGEPDDFYGYWAGTGLTLKKENNEKATGHIWSNYYPSGGDNGIMVASSRFGNGRIVGTGDSSPIDDGTGNAGNDLYNGWAAGSDSIIILNTTYWLCNPEESGINEENINFGNEEIIVDSRDNTIILMYKGDSLQLRNIIIYDCMGRVIKQERYSNSIEISNDYLGIYFLMIVKSKSIKSYKLNLFGGGICLLSE
jgi:hypothetical protein